jgi:hypothetical protein
MNVGSGWASGAGGRARVFPLAIAALLGNWSCLTTERSPERDAGSIGGDALGPTELDRAGLAPVVVPDFGRTSCGPGQGSLQLFWIENQGGQRSGVPVVDVTGEGFTIDINGCTSPIPVLERCAVQVRFHPASVGQKQGQLKIQAEPGGTLTIPLHGEAFSPSTPQVVPADVRFDDVVAGGTSGPFSLFLLNLTCTPLEDLSVSVDPDFALLPIAPRCPSTLAPGQCFLNVAFTPRTSGPKTGTLVVRAAHGVELTVALHGRGI